MRKATMLAVVVIVVSLATLTTVLALRLYYHTSPSTMVTVRVTSDPPGATLSKLAPASVLGTTPLTMRYALPDQWRNCVSYDGLEANWPNGVQLEVRAIELCPEGGTDQEIRLASPTRQQTRRTRVVPSQPSQAGPLSDALTPMDLSVPDSEHQAAPAIRSDVLTPMDLSVPGLRAAIISRPSSGNESSPTREPPPISADTRIPVRVAERQSSETG